jgi:DNA-binding SARP family transcriptional activator
MHYLEFSISMADIECRILGTFEIRVDDHVLPIRELRHQRLLGTMLSEVNTNIPLSRLTAAIWPDGIQPASVKAQIHICVSVLRRKFREHGVAREVIQTRPPGYAIAVDEENVDAMRFRGLVRQGRELRREGKAEEAIARFRRALSMWRGTPNFDGSPAHSTTGYWEQQRLLALEECVELELQMGRHAEVIPELYMLVYEFPYQEKLLGSLMLALSRDGQRIAALDCYRRFHQRLIDDAGLYPKGVLTLLNDSIIRGESAIELPKAW